MVTAEAAPPPPSSSSVCGSGGVPLLSGRRGDHQPQQAGEVRQALWAPVRRWNRSTPADMALLNRGGTPP
ncbi:Hypothetical protein SCLAV_p1384 (plasmid) [Streptomyces clavuligerus]|uniref:Uncharacterized protein n=1 Tax=Streptomyces clavuligerus TaxID=1901 RepID=D5SLS5_STRCL|nr:Hypothetical protein SCLAV_p1384 [Streptomyces clavuligerus]